MARYTGAVCRLCRREGQKLFLKGERCYTGKCAISRRAYAPGQHGQARNKKASEYGKQLRTKQFAKRYYGVLEGQFYHYYEMATKMQGVTGENLLRWLCVVPCRSTSTRTARSLLRQRPHGQHSAPTDQGGRSGSGERSQPFAR